MSGLGESARRLNPAVRAAPKAMAGLVLLAAAAAPAQVSRQAADGNGRLYQTAELVDTWGDRSPAHSEPYDVVMHTRLVRRDSDVTRADFVLAGPWGTHLESFDEDSSRTEGRHQTFARTTWRAVDLDDDGQTELVFLARTVEADLPLDSTGGVMAGPPAFTGWALKVTALARVNGSLVQEDIPAEPSSPAFAAILRQEWGGALGAELQAAAGDALFARHAFQDASYRYRVAREWAERTLTGRQLALLTPDSPLEITDPDDATVLWIVVERRRLSLPPAFQRSPLGP